MVSEQRISGIRVKLGSLPPKTLRATDHGPEGSDLFLYRRLEQVPGPIVERRNGKRRLQRVGERPHRNVPLPRIKYRHPKLRTSQL